MKLGIGLWRFFRDSHPTYLAQYYWWAYLWRFGAWFFDHQPIINCILFGQYRILSKRTIRACTTNPPQGRVLQLTCAYGEFTNALLSALGEDLYLMDVSTLQLSLALKKEDTDSNNHIIATRMNAEQLAYNENAFATIVVFFLLHELPHEARHRCFAEIIRVLQPGGRLVITEYGEQPEQHWLWRWRLLCGVILWLEPFLGDFWRLDLTAILNENARRQGKQLELINEFRCFNGFYRVCVYELSRHTETED